MNTPKKSHSPLSQLVGELSNALCSAGLSEKQVGLVLMNMVPVIQKTLGTQKPVDLEPKENIVDFKLAQEVLRKIIDGSK